MRSLRAALCFLVILAAEFALQGHAASQSGRELLRATRGGARALLQSRSSAPLKSAVTDDSAWMRATPDASSVGAGAPLPRQPPPDSPRGKQNGPQDSKGEQALKVQALPSPSPSTANDWWTNWDSILENALGGRSPSPPPSPSSSDGDWLAGWGSVAGKALPSPSPSPSPSPDPSPTPSPADDDWLAGWGSVLENQKAPKEPRAPRSPRKPTAPPDAPPSPPDAPVEPPSPPQPPSPRPSSPRPPSPRPPSPRPSPPRPPPAKGPPPQSRPPVPRRSATGLIGERGEEVRSPPPAPSAEWLAGPGKGSTSPIIDPTILLDAHNRYRMLSGVANLTWDATLSRQAQAWADKCVAAHSGTPATGENYAWGVYLAPEETVSGVVGWANEICNYNWKNPGFTAGHYTQIVWKSTQRMGCGYKLCNPTPGSGSKNGWLVCQYLPPGNMQGVQNYRDNVLQPKNLPTTCNAAGPAWDAGRR